jgi:hypothetical protein
VGVKTPGDHSEDGRQKSIEAVHRGFLYQHLYGVACVLLARTDPAVKQVTTEQDEDIEVVLASERRYIQVKYRSSPLQLSEVSGVLDRFVAIHGEHSEGHRQGEPRFLIVCNREPAAALRNDSRVTALRVLLVHPMAPPPEEWTMPPAFATVHDALEWCRHQAELIPQTRLVGRTLVWKLATEVALAAAGHRLDGHVFVTSELDELFELLYVRNQHLPNPPAPYRPFEFEPSLDNPRAVTLVVGLSGAGKTGWLAERALHLADIVVYFDVGDNSDTTVAPALVREITGVLADSGASHEMRQALYAGASGLTSLNAIGVMLKRSGAAITIALDNIHRIGATRTSELVSAIPSARWILLAQPSAQIPELRARLGCEEQNLGGLTVEAVAGVFHDTGSPVTVTQAQRLRAITGGLPLFVRDAALLCLRRFGGDSEALCAALEAATTTESTGQDAVLRGSVDHVGPSAARAAAALSLSSVRLKEPEAVSLLMDGLGLEALAATSCIRELTDWGIGQIFANRDIAIHDAFRPVFRTVSRLSGEETNRVLTVLSELLRRSISPSTPDRFIAYCRIAPRVGEADVVIDMAGSIPEHLYEHGSSDALRRILSETLHDSGLSAVDRFWAADTLMFWKLQSGEDVEQIREDMKLLEQLLVPASTDPRARQTVAIKRLLIAGKSHDLNQVRTAYAKAHPDAFNDPHGWLILRYTYAVGLIYCEALESADLVTATVASGYLDLIRLRPDQLFATNAIDIRRALGEKATEIELIKHVADAVELRAQVVSLRGGVVALLKMWAFKLYALAGAPLSAVKAGKDVVDELISIGAVDLAKSFLERTLIPGIAEYRLPEEIIPLRAQYAVVLAYDGQVERARKEMNELRVFTPSSPLLAAEFENQRHLIEEIGSGHVRLPPSRRGGMDERALLLDAPRLNAGRNEPCPCNSTLKFKRCCGR